MKVKKMPYNSLSCESRNKSLRKEVEQKQTKRGVFLDYAKINKNIINLKTNKFEKL